MSSKSGKEIEKRPADPGAIEKVLGSEHMQKQLLSALPRHLAPQQIVRQAITMLRNTPKLCECSAVSVISGIFKSAELGLALSGPLGQAYLVPRWNGKLGMMEATFQVGYRGIFQLAYRSKLVKKIEMRTHHANDAFDIRLGTGSHLNHVPNLQNPGDAVGYYTVATLADGTQDFEYMTKQQVEKHRDKYTPEKGRAYSGWATNFDEMAQKTTARRLGKRLPAATELSEAIGEDERGEMAMVACSNFLNPADVAGLDQGASKMEALAEEATLANSADEGIEAEDERRRAEEEKA